MSKRVLLIAFHYPPVKGSSGVQRALKFSTYLHEYGWSCDVLTVCPRAYTKVGNDELKDIPSHINVERALALNVAKDFSFFDRHPGFLALPDNWANWRYDGYRRAKKMHREKQYSAIWSTFPITTAHVIAYKLAQKFKLPWIADCRDSMSEPGYPPDPKKFRCVRMWEKRIVENASRVAFTTPGAQKMYQNRYPEVPHNRWVVIENGYDEQSFEGLSLKPHNGGAGRVANDRPITLVHAGILYPSERDPLPFFKALRALKKRQVFNEKPLRIVLRATGHDQTYLPVLKELEIEDVVTLEPGVPYREALQEMMLADGLLIFQASNCNHQIPAKVYEYFRAGRPILALTDPAGDTAQVLRQNQHEHLCRLNDQLSIEKGLVAFIKMLPHYQAQDMSMVASKYSRQSQTAQLANLLDEIL